MDNNKNLSTYFNIDMMCIEWKKEDMENSYCCKLVRKSDEYKKFFFKMELVRLSTPVNLNMVTTILLISTFVVSSISLLLTMVNATNNKLTFVAPSIMNRLIEDIGLNETLSRLGYETIDNFFNAVNTGDNILLLVINAANCYWIVTIFITVVMVLGQFLLDHLNQKRREVVIEQLIELGVTHNQVDF